MEEDNKILSLTKWIEYHTRKMSGNDRNRFIDMCITKFVEAETYEFIEPIRELKK